MLIKIDGVNQIDDKVNIINGYVINMQAGKQEFKQVRSGVGEVRAIVNTISSQIEMYSIDNCEVDIITRDKRIVALINHRSGKGGAFDELFAISYKRGLTLTAHYAAPEQAE